MIPLPFTCQHLAYAAGAEDDHGNAIVGWAEPVDVACFWYPKTSSRQLGDESVSNEQSSVDLELAIDPTVVVDQRDRFTIGGKDFEVVGLPEDYNHGPYKGPLTASPLPVVLELKWVG